MSPCPQQPKYSITLPSIHPHLCAQTIDSIRRCSRGLNYEILVVSKFAVSGPDIVHVPEDVALGNCAAHARGYEEASGDVVVAMCDDHLACDGWLTGLAELLAHKEQTHFPFAAGLDRPEAPWFGTVYGLYYPYFPAATRDSVERIGGWYSPAYRAHFGDPDIGMRVWEHGGRCEFLPGRCVTANPAAVKSEDSPHKRSTFPVDFAAFMGRYDQRFGAGFPKDFRSINSDYMLEHLRDGSFDARVPQAVHLAAKAAGG